MKILLDENIPIDLKFEFIATGFEVITVKELNWLGIKNGELLKRMVDHNFNVLITMDKKLSYQQSISKLNLTMIVLDVFNNKLQILRPFISEVIEILDSSIEFGIISIKV